MIYTTYFANLKNFDRKISCPIAICIKPPNGYKGLVYKKLAPTWKILKEWKENHNENLYKVCFQNEILESLCIDQVMEDLRFLINKTYNCGIIKNYKWWENISFDIYLVCYEKKGDFCHRHLVSEWMNKNGVYVREK